MTRRPRARLAGTTAMALAALVVASVVPLGPNAGAAPVGRRAVVSASSATSTAGPAAGAHEASEGLRLAPAGGETVRSGQGCRSGAPRRSYAVSAVAVDLTLNRYLDHDPQARMYVLDTDLPRVRGEEARNRAARESGADPAVSLGLQGDAIQPLTLRAHPGDCLRIKLTNRLPGDERASFHLHGSSLRVAGTQRPAVVSNPRATVAAGRAVTYEWAIPSDEPEGTHYAHSHAEERFQTGHGLFAAVVVEPPGSTWLDPLSGGATATGWMADISPPKSPPFREFVLYYHEIGTEKYQLLDRNGAFIPLVDPLLNAYRPGARAINYRSEPFLNRMALQQAGGGAFDESAAYSSYSFGDPATPIARAYLGDRVKQRVVHAGAEVFHVHHVHGGSIRWRRQPGVDTPPHNGLLKHPPVRAGRSTVVDSQSIGPSEAYDTENECGAGGCQQGAGDYLFHCHVAHHYFAGMWGIWRVYNTLQDGPGSTDDLPPLQPLAGRTPSVAPSVTSDRLVGTTVDSFGKRTSISADGLGAWVEAQLPPPGVPRGPDASVLDWTREGDRYLGEVEDDRDWPGHHPEGPGIRPPLRFDPRTGKLAYPFLRPHLGRRPPFAPGHGPAPFLDPDADGRSPPQPGAAGPGSLCPKGTRLQSLAINAVTVPVPLNDRTNLVDPAGELYVLRQDEDALRADPSRRKPLAIRANAGQDCVDVLFRSELEDSPANHGYAKADIHIHFVQFDVQASDGVVTGFNYEQSVRPFTVEGERLTAPAAAGADRVALTSASRFQPGALVGVGMDEDETFEVHRIAAVVGPTLVFDAPLSHDHPAGAVVSTEFVRYRWYPDTQFGTAFFHDHVNALSSWSHGLFGAFISEPPGSTYHDPHTGSELTSGALADVHTDRPDRPVTMDVAGSFREAVLFIQDQNPINTVGRSSGSSVNLRAERLADRGDDPTRWFSSEPRGDPVTPLIEADVGDPVVLRTLVAGTNDVHTWHVDGHWFRAETDSPTSPPTNTAHLGISERADLVIPRAGGPQRRPGDYLYYSGRSFKLREGSWGILRVHPPGRGDGLQPLPGRPAPRPPAPVCPAGAPVRRFQVAAVDLTLPLLGAKPGKAYVLEADVDAVTSGRKPAAPLVLHVGVGDCIAVDLTNRTTGGPVSIHADLLSFDPATSAGVAAGREPRQAVDPGGTRRFTFYSSPEVGPTTALLRDWGDVGRNPGLGLYGAVVVTAAGAAVSDPVTGADAAGRSGWAVDVRPNKGRAYRDFTLFLQDEDAGIGTHRMPYTENVAGPVGINYRATPFTGARPARATTPELEAFAGDPVRVHVVVPWSEQAQVFSIENHRWQLEPGEPGSDLLDAVQVGGLEAVTLDLESGAGGAEHLPGDYEYGDHRQPYREAGMWGVFRVRCLGGLRLRPLPAGAAGPGDVVGPCRPPAAPGGWTGPLLGLSAFAGLVVLAAVGARRSSRRPAA